MSATATAIPSKRANERVWTGNFTEDHNKWPEPTREELREAIERIQAEQSERYGTKPARAGA